VSLAADIYRRLDENGLTPPVHYTAAPAAWRTALESMQAEIEGEMEHLLMLCESSLTPREPGKTLLQSLRKLEK